MKFIAFLLVVIAITGCEKSVENFSPFPTGNDTVWSVYNSASLSVNELHQTLTLPAMADSINLLTGGTITFSNNTRVVLPPAAFTNGNAGVDGKGTVELNLLQQKGDFIRFRRPTTSNGYLLQSSGLMNITVKKNGQPLQLLPNKTLQVFYADSQPNAVMRGFYGVPANANGFENFDWQPVADSSLRILPLATGYQLISNRQQWIGSSFFSDTAAQKSRTVLSMPRDFTNANTSAFIVFKNIRAVMQFNPDVANRIWITQKVPVGKEVLYVTITKKKDEYWLARQDATTATFQNIHLVPEKKTLQAINSFLDGL